MPVVRGARVRAQETLHDVDPSWTRQQDPAVRLFSPRDCLAESKEGRAATAYLLQEHDSRARQAKTGWLLKKRQLRASRLRWERAAHSAINEELAQTEALDLAHLRRVS